MRAVAPHEAIGSPEERHRAEDEQGRKQGRVRPKGAGRSPCRVWAGLMELLGTAMMVVRHWRCCRRLVVGAGDDRDCSTIEGWHEPRWREQPHCEQQREQRSDRGAG